MTTFLGDVPPKVREHDRRFVSFSTPKDTDKPIATAAQINSPLVFAFNFIAKLTAATFAPYPGAAAPVWEVAQDDRGYE